jgi:BolA family transcriptional regulator, general stress-responsive regulator
MISPSQTSPHPLSLNPEDFLRRIAPLNPLHYSLDDESEAHRGHAGASGGAGHYHLCIVSEVFNGMQRLQRHRAVYQCFHDLIPHRIHALSIDAFSPSEYDGLFGTTSR